MGSGEWAVGSGKKSAFGTSGERAGIRDKGEGR
jgi:hypothetical protein